MSTETTEVIGQIKIDYTLKGMPTITIVGEIPSRQYNALRVHLSRAYRKHLAEIRMASGRADMQDKGKTVADLKQEELDAMEPAPVAGADELNITPPPAAVTVNDIVPDGTDEAPVEEANEPKEESEIEDATEQGTEDIHRDDAGPGSQEGPAWQK